MKNNLVCNFVIPDFINELAIGPKEITVRIVFPITAEMARIIGNFNPNKTIKLNCSMPAFKEVEVFSNKKRWYFAVTRSHTSSILGIEDVIYRAYQDKDHLKVFFREIKKLVLDEEIEQIERDALGCDYDVDLPY